MGPVLLIAVWWVAYACTLVDPHLLPSPFATLSDASKSIASGAMTPDFLQTLLRVTYAFAIATSFGVPVGIMLGANEGILSVSRVQHRFFQVDGRRPRCFPCSCFCLGLGTFPRYPSQRFSAWLVIVFNVAYGVMNARKTRILAARSMGRESAAHLQRRHLLRNSPQDFYWSSDGRVGRPGCDHSCRKCSSARSTA